MNTVLPNRLRKSLVILGWLFGAIVILGLGMLFGQTINYMRAIQAGEPNPIDKLDKARFEVNMSKLLDQTSAVNVDLSRLESASQKLSLGNPEAKIRIIEFLDYECPFSRRSAPAVRAFMARHSNEVEFEVRDFPIASLHEHAMAAAIAARCVFAQGEANKFWRYYDLLFQNQERLDEAALRLYAARVDAELTAFDVCVASRQPLADVRADYDNGLAVGVRGTPTFFMNNLPLPGALDLATLEAAYESLKKKL